MNVQIGNYRVWLCWPVRLKRHVAGRDTRRGFTHTQQVEVWTQQDGKCGNGALGCGGALDLRTVVYHHVVPWYRRGQTVVENCVALCPNCHQALVFADALGRAEDSRAAIEPVSESGG